nr:MAG TPA: hypothetical protein [Caudoviricetes sp.]
MKFYKKFVFSGLSPDPRALKILPKYLFKFIFNFLSFPIFSY